MNLANLIAEIHDERRSGFYVPVASRVLTDLRFITGFRQNLHAPTGLEWAWDSIWRLVDDEFPTANVRIQLHRWDEDFRGLAEQMARVYRPYREAGYRVRIVLVGYSWGVGRGVAQLTWAMHDLGFEVDLVYAIDGVYYNPLMIWRAMRSPLLSPLIGVPTIKLPSKVKNVKMWRQKQDYPRGHDILILDDNGTPTSIGVEGRDRFLSMGHCAIDESVTILDDLKRDIRSMLAGTWGEGSRGEGPESRARGETA